MKTSLLVILAGSLMACRAKDDNPPKNPPQEQRQDAGEAKEPEKKSGGFASPLGFMNLLGGANEPDPYDEPEESPGYSAAGPRTYVVELSGEITERKSFEFWSGASGLEIAMLLKKMDEWATDAKVPSLLFRFSDLSMGWAHAEELRAGFQQFRSKGKKIFCFTEHAEGAVYSVMTACDSIGLVPSGDLMLTGVAAMPVHIKGALDKLQVQADFVHIGAFKGAAEPLTRDRPSPEMVETLNGILDEQYATFVRALSEGRKLDAAVVRDLIDQGWISGPEALQAKLVDKIDIYEKYRDGVLAGTEWKEIKLSEKGMEGLFSLLGGHREKRPNKPHVALLYAVGDVVDGMGDSSLSAHKEIAARRLSSALRAVGSDDNVKAVVLRVDSPGGSALASEIIYHATQEVMAKKPLIVSMGPLAASGGYYISAGATKIFALANTLTGSIGVVGGKIAIASALENFGVKSFPMGRGKHSLMWNSLGTWSAEERALVTARMSDVYETFVGRVAAGRKKKVEEVKALAQGRVWTGAAAKERGLVDEIGGLGQALTEARKLAKLEADTPLEIYPQAPTLSDILGSFGNVSSGFLQGRVSAEFVMQLERALGKVGARGVLRLCKRVENLTQSPIQTALFWPL